MRVTVELRGTVVTDLRLNMRHPEIASAMLQGYRDAGFHSFTESYSFGKDKRSIKAELGKISNLSTTKTPDGSITRGVVRLPWAAIQDQGGVIPARTSRDFAATGRGRAQKGQLSMFHKPMVFGYKGKTRFAYRVKESVIVGKNYIALGLARVVERTASIFDAVLTTKKI